MAQGEVTGATAAELEEMEWEHRQSPLYENHGIPFEVAYCLAEIGKQPEDYTGPTRYCQRRAVKKDDYEGHQYDEAAYGPSCPFHGGTHWENSEQNLDHHGVAPIKHGLHADDEHLRMDFTDTEQSLHDEIIEQWPDAYDWPPRSDDPARYLILEKVAVNAVRSVRAEDYLDEEGEVHLAPIFDDQGVQIGEEPEENALSREYRLLIDEILDHLKELGLTPKERQRMDTMEAEERQSDAVAEIAQDALGEDHDYNPEEFTDGND